MLFKQTSWTRWAFQKITQMNLIAKELRTIWLQRLIGMHLNNSLGAEFGE
jgi:hypothetical protein